MGQPGSRDTELDRRPRALVVEDTPNIAKLVQRGLLLAGIDAEIASDGHAALAAFRDNPPELVILDLMLPGVDGIEICRRIRAADRADGRHPTLILMLTARGTVADRISGLDAGADDYLVKPFSIDEFLARVRALLRRAGAGLTESPSAQILSFDDLSVDLGSRMTRRGERIIDLTAREFDLLTFFLRHPHQVLHREQIRDRVWGADFFGESNVIAVTIGTLRQALEQDGEPRLLQTVRGVGYVLRRPRRLEPTGANAGRRLGTLPSDR
ncbi:MAG: response regulator transcription factor [Thermomicrobiales bacterium]